MEVFPLYSNKNKCTRIQYKIVRPQRRNNAEFVIPFVFALVLKLIILFWSFAFCTNEKYAHLIEVLFERIRGLIAMFPTGQLHGNPLRHGNLHLSAQGCTQSWYPFILCPIWQEKSMLKFYLTFSVIFLLNKILPFKLRNKWR